MMTDAPLVGIIMGSDSDLKVMSRSAAILDELSIPYEITIVSAHRTPHRLMTYATSAVSRGLEVIIAGAGGAAHLPGMIAASTVLPVIGVPIKLQALDGLDALLAIVQMPKGVPVATVAIDNATNAALLASQILATSRSDLRGRLEARRKSEGEQVLTKAKRLERLGARGYLEGEKVKPDLG